MLDLLSLKSNVGSQLARAGLSLWGFAVATAFLPGMYSGPYLPRYWVIAAGLALLPRLDFRRFDRRSLWCLGAILIWSMLTLIWTPGLYGGTFTAATLIAAAIIMLATASLTSAERDSLLIGFAAGISVNSVLAWAQHFGYSGIAQSPSVYVSGLFFNPEIYAEAMAPIFVWALVGRRYALSIVTGMGLIFCREHIALFIAVCGAVYGFIPSWRWRAPIFAFLIAVGVTSLASTPSSVDTRILYWATALRSLTFAGGGLGWWYQAHPFAFEEFVHSDLLQFGVEFGIVGLLWPSFLMCVWWRSESELPERALFLAMVVEFVFSFPLHMPATLFLFAISAGAVARRRRHLHQPQLSSGDAFAADIGRRPSYGFRVFDRLRSGRGAIPVRPAYPQLSLVHSQANPERIGAR